MQLPPLMPATGSRLAAVKLALHDPTCWPPKVTSLALWMADDHQAELNVWMSKRHPPVQSASLGSGLKPFNAATRVVIRMDAK